MSEPAPGGVAAAHQLTSPSAGTVPTHVTGRISGPCELRRTIPPPPAPRWRFRHLTGWSGRGTASDGGAERARSRARDERRTPGTRETTNHNSRFGHIRLMLGD